MNWLPLPTNGSSFAVCTEEACHGARITKRSGRRLLDFRAEADCRRAFARLVAVDVRGSRLLSVNLTLADIERSVTPSSSRALVLRLQFVIKALRTGKIGFDYSLRWWAIVPRNGGRLVWPIFPRQDAHEGDRRTIWLPTRCFGMTDISQRELRCPVAIRGRLKCHNTRYRKDARCFGSSGGARPASGRENTLE